MPNYKAGLRRLSDRRGPQPEAGRFSASEIKTTGSFAAGVLSVSALSLSRGVATDSVERLSGIVVSVWGYVSATPQAQHLLLSEESTSYCQMCGISHTDGPSILVSCRDDSLGSVPDTHPVVVEGRVSIRTTSSGTFFDPQVELLEAVRRKELE